MRAKHRRILAFLIAMVFIAAAVFSVLFIVRQAGHDCAGEGCAVCACVERAERTLRQLGGGMAGTASLTLAVWLVAAAVSLAFLPVPAVSLTGQKIRLND